MKEVRLGDICDFQGGSQPPKCEWIKQSQPGYIRMLQIRDFTKLRRSEPEYVKLSPKLRVCKDDDILIGRYGASVGKVLTGLSGAYNVAIIKAIPNEHRVFKPYLKIIFESHDFQKLLQKVCNQRTAQAGFSKEDIVDFAVSLPSLDEQKRIVEILDQEFARIDALKANAEKSLKNAQDLFNSSLRNELLPKENWTVELISKAVKEIFAGGDVPKDSFSQEKTETFSIPIYGNAVESDGLYGYTAITRVAEPSITIAGRGSGTGHVIKRKEPYYPIVRLIVVIPDQKKITIDYLHYYLKSVDFKISGSAIPQLTVPKVKNETITYPSLFEQTRIVSVLQILEQNCNQLQNNYEKTIALCDNLKQSLLRKAFNGDL